MTPSTDNRQPGSRRSRSRRSRTRHRDGHRHHRSRTRPRCRVKKWNKNFAAAVCNMFTIVLLCAALTEPKWISMQGGGCVVGDKPLLHLGAYQFFYPGKFAPLEKDFSANTLSHIVYQFGPNDQDLMDNCVNYKAALIMKTVIVFCLLACVSSLLGFVLDLTVPKNRPLKLLQRNAIPSIITVIISVVINLLSYWLSTEVEVLQKDTKFHPGSKVIVDFDISFYLVTAAGGLSIIAAAFNCLKRHPVFEDSQGESLLEDYDGMNVVPPVDVDMSHVLNLPPPPAYTP